MILNILKSLSILGQEINNFMNVFIFKRKNK